MYIMSEKIILNNWKTQMSAYEWRKKPQIAEPERRQPARRHHLHQGVPALLRREREHEWKRPAKQVEKRQQ